MIRTIFIEHASVQFRPPPGGPYEPRTLIRCPRRNDLNNHNHHMAPLTEDENTAARCYRDGPPDGARNSTERIALAAAPGASG
jgi:hypothetical protein